MTQTLAERQAIAHFMFPPIPRWIRSPHSRAVGTEYRPLSAASSLGHPYYTHTYFVHSFKLSASAVIKKTKPVLEKEGEIDRN